MRTNVRKLVMTGEFGNEYIIYIKLHVLYI